MSRSKPPLSVRLVLLVLLGGVAAIDRNPIVTLEAWLGLSPSPLERFFGVRGYFSGMTEAAHRLAHFDLLGAAKANLLVFPTLFAFACVILFWTAPKLRTRSQEIAFFAFIIGGTAVNNYMPAILSA